MNHSARAARQNVTPGQRTSSRLGVVAAMVLALVPAVPTSTHAMDGCPVLLCLAAPSWRSIAQCSQPVRLVFKDLAQGKAPLTCSTSGAGNSVSHAWSSAPAFCPPQYTRIVDSESEWVYQCDYLGAISVVVSGALFTRTWWSPSGDSVTEFSPAAKAQLQSWDTRFDNDYAKWLATVAPRSVDLP